MEGVLTAVKVSDALSAKDKDRADWEEHEITEVPSHREITFRLMVLYRWLALAAALLLTFFLPGNLSLVPPFIIAGIVLADTLIITLTSRSLNRLLYRSPLLLGFDLLFVGGVLAATGGWHSPYYLYALSPILAAAFFFQWRGALIAASVLAVLFGAGLWWQWLSFGVSLLIVADDGIGFNPEAVEQSYHHFGLLGMQERINLLEGHLTVDHRCNRGTMVMATVPLQNGKR